MEAILSKDPSKTNNQINPFPKNNKSYLEIEKLEKDLNQQKKHIKNQLLYSLFKKEKDTELKLERIRKLRSICQNADNKEIKDLRNMIKEAPKAAEKSIYISARQETDNAKGKIEQPIEKEKNEESVDEKDSSQELEKRKRMPNNKEFEEKEEDAKDVTFIGKELIHIFNYLLLLKFSFHQFLS